MHSTLSDRRGWAVVLISSFAVGMISAAATSPLYENERYGFRIDPGGREVTPTPANDIDTFAVGIASETGWQLSVRIAPVDPPATAATLRERAIERIERDPRYNLDETFEDRVAGRAAAGISVEYSVNGVAYTIEARIVVANDLRYIVQSSARASEYATHTEEFSEVIDSLELLPVAEDRRREFRLEGLADRCGSELTWAPTWEEAAARSKREGRPILVVARFYPGFDLSDRLASGALFDRDVIALIESRCVPFRLRKGDPVPFAAYERYGLGPNTFGQAILLVDADGEVIGETSRADPLAVDDFLVRALSGLPDRERVSPDLEGARWSLERGDLGAAAAILAEAETVEELILRARLHRRMRDGEAALADLAQIGEIAGSEAPPEVAIEAALIHIGMGAPEQARPLLESFLREHPGHSRATETRYWLGALHHQDGDDDGAKAIWYSIVESQPEDRWGWKAAAALTSTALKLGVRSSLRWPTEREMREFRTLAPAKPADLATVEAEAAAFLIAQQLDDGGWIYPATIGYSEAGPPQPIEHAVVALVGDCLLLQREIPGAEPAIERALAAVFAARERVRREGEFLHYMDYWVWAKGYQLRFIASCLEAGIGPRNALLETAGDLVAELGERQRSSGGWSYYLTRDLSSAAEDTQSISFVTAPTLLSLLRAREAEIEVPEAMVEAALDCLEAMRNEDGSYDYMGGIDSSGSSQGRTGSAGRGPLCAFALHRGGRVELDVVREALELFAEHRADLAREQGKNLMHAGPGGLGSHYLLFDYACAATAVHALPAGERAPYRKVLHDLVGATRYEGGGYLDNPGMGRACGTALALQAYHDLARD